MMSQATRAALVDTIAAAIFASIKPELEYVVINGSVAEFNAARLLLGAPTRIAGYAEGLGELRGNHIYEVVDADVPAAGQVGSQWAGMIEINEVGKWVLGREITVAEIRAAAEKDVAIRISLLQPEG